MPVYASASSVPDPEMPLGRRGHGLALYERKDDPAVGVQAARAQQTYDQRDDLFLHDV